MSFKHKPLDISCRQIRLVRILPLGETESSIACEIQHFDLNDRELPPYRALSYTWGSADDIRTISVCRKPCVVRKNLYDFLYGTDRDNTYFWIDQLCIDQEMTSERNHQVAMMAEIYKKAFEVVIWLGTVDIENQQAKTALRFFNHLAAEDDGLQTTYPKIAKELNVAPDTLSGSLKYFCGNDYWHRVWIVQEVILAPSLKVKWGSHWIEWDAISRAVDLPNDPLSKQVSELVYNSRRFHGTDYGTNLFALLGAFGQNQCSNPRDRVYAMLGIVNVGHITVDYSKGIEDVFLDAVSAILLEADTHLGGFISTCNALAEGMMEGRVRFDAKKMIRQRPVLITLRCSVEQSELMVEYYRKSLAGESPVLEDYVLLGKLESVPPRMPLLLRPTSPLGTTFEI